MLKLCLPSPSSHLFTCPDPTPSLMSSFVFLPCAFLLMPCPNLMKIMFNLDRVHMILDEMIVNGQIVETNKNRILAPVAIFDKAAN